MSTVAALPFSAWPTGRKLAAGVFAVAGYLALACAAVYLSGVLFLVLNKANPKQAQFTSIVRYWDLYADDAQLRKKLQLAIGASGIGLLILLPAGLVAAARPRRALHGDARFASPAEVDRAGLTGGDGQPGILIGRHRGKFLSLPGQLSVMLSAPTRSGKGVGVVIPNLLNWPDSVVVLDIKGENYDITAGYRAAHGQAVCAFSPFDEDARSHRWNPLTAVRSSPLHRVGDLLTIGQVFFPNDGGGTSPEAFFNDQARNLFLGLGLVLLETPSLPRTIGEMLRQSSGKGRSLKDHLSGLITQRREEGNPLSDECTDALQRLLSNSENTLSSVVATFNAPLTIFADAIVDAATSADDFRLEDVRRRRMSVYVRIPPNRLANARPLLNLFFSQLVSLNTQALPEQDPTLKVQCLLVNDEFTAMGRVGVITNAAAFLAGYNLRLLTVVQAMSQLDAVYGDKEARTFATNHGLQILYAPREQRDADEYSAMLGHFTERATSRGRSRSFSGHGHSTVSRNESEQRRALLLPQEFKELGSERLVVIFENCKPILGEKIRYYRDKAFTSRLLKPPAVPRMDMDLHLARVQQRWRYADDELPAGQTLSLEALAHDHTLLLDSFEGPPDKVADELLTFFDKGAPGIPGVSGMGGSIEPIADEDGVLLAESDTTETTLDVAALDADIDVAPGVERGPQETQIVP
ncbi:type IV secretory system conjugative DNA transfer family protein [Methylibium petroleiphilum]|uniref:type IV secretory system conjugative DNA transfer family protein n=1 Tax=Methylibium petroleiphilum TaxID=105560 RepID=UPI001AC706ED|nr:type IV secretory system conjugative DNA transfer family protein [Methylibium petroleiphilum]MBN9202994.1 type IV secretory system conjugative DNA transfer family protein [Methylibium petroleiphilum]